jgi:hypothetical protein
MTASAGFLKLLLSPGRDFSNGPGSRLEVRLRATAMDIFPNRLKAGGKQHLESG